MRSARPAPPTPRAYARADSPLAAAFTLAAAKDLPEGSLHVGRLHDLLDDIPNPAHKLLFIAFNTGPSIPRARLLRTVSGLPNPTRHFIFQFSGPCGPLLLRLAPSAPRWGQVPGVVRRLKFPFDCCSDENRCSCSYSRNRCSHSTSKHRHSGSRCCCHDRPHGLWGGATFQMQKYYFQIII